MLEVGERRPIPLPMPMRLVQRGTGRFVAHVRAVRQVVGAEAADHQLIDERRPRSRCGPTYRKRHRSGESRARSSSAINSNAASQLIGCIVRSRPGRSTIGWVSRPCCRARSRCAPGGAATGMRGEELRAHPTGRGFFGDRLGAVLAELGVLAVPGCLGPCTSWTVESHCVGSAGPGCARCAPRPSAPGLVSVISGPPEHRRHKTSRE